MQRSSFVPVTAPVALHPPHYKKCLCRSSPAWTWAPHLVHLVKDGHELLSLRLPEELGHAAVANQGGEHLAKVVAGDDDGDAANPVALTPLLPDGDLVGRVADVHQSAHHHLVVHLHAFCPLSH